MLTERRRAAGKGTSLLQPRVVSQRVEEEVERVVRQRVEEVVERVVRQRVEEVVERVVMQRVEEEVERVVRQRVEVERVVSRRMREELERVVVFVAGVVNSTVGVKTSKGDRMKVVAQAAVRCLGMEGYNWEDVRDGLVASEGKG